MASEGDLDLASGIVSRMASIQSAHGCFSWAAAAEIQTVTTGDMPESGKTCPRYANHSTLDATCADLTSRLGDMTENVCFGIGLKNVSRFPLQIASNQRQILHDHNIPIERILHSSALAEATGDEERVLPRPRIRITPASA